MGRLLRLVEKPRHAGFKLDEETYRRLKLASVKVDMAMSDLVEAAIRLLLLAMEEPGIIDLSRVSARDQRLAGLLRRAVERASQA